MTLNRQEVCLKHMVPPTRGMSCVKKWDPTIQVAQHLSLIKKKKKKKKKKEKKRSKYYVGIGTVATCRMLRDWQCSFWIRMVLPTWWVSAWFIHPLSDVSATTLSTLVCILMFDCVVQYCKFQRYMILIRFPCKILEIYLVRYMINCEFVMIRGSFGGPFGCNQSRGGIDRKWIELLTRSLNSNQKIKFVYVCLFV